MSIILRKDGVGWLFAKGTDNSMISVGREDVDI